MNHQVLNNAEQKVHKIKLWSNQGKPYLLETPPAQNDHPKVPPNKL